jgi:hypothetical protein
MTRLLALFALVLTWPTPSPAQVAPAVVLDAPAPPRWDVSADAGWLSRDKPDVAPAWDRWIDAPIGSIAVGRYWTPHLKSELRGAFSGTATLIEQNLTAVPGLRYPIYDIREHRVSTQSLGAALSYQFFRNQWFHPHLGVGVEATREHDRLDSTVTWSAAPYLATGFKWYVSERGFVRSDARVSFAGRGTTQFAWTAGIGVDL